MTEQEARAKAEQLWPARKGWQPTIAWLGCRIDGEVVEDFRVGEANIYDEQEGVIGWLWHGRGNSFEEAFAAVVPMRPGLWRIAGTKTDTVYRLRDENTAAAGDEILPIAEAERILNAHEALVKALEEADSLVYRMRTDPECVSTIDYVDQQRNAYAALKLAGVKP